MTFLPLMMTFMNFFPQRATLNLKPLAQRWPFFRSTEAILTAAAPGRGIGPRVRFEQPTPVADDPLSLLTRSRPKCRSDSSSFRHVSNPISRKIALSYFKWGDLMVEHLSDFVLCWSIN